MPCNTDYMEPSVKERQRREAAELLVYVREATGQPVSDTLRHAASDLYGGGHGDHWVKTLCYDLTYMRADVRDRIVYDARNKTARRLADWWEEHQEEDAKREAAELKAAKSFDACVKIMARMQDGVPFEDVAEDIAKATNKYYDPEDSVHVFTFDDGVIIMSRMDGGIAYKGSPFSG